MCAVTSLVRRNAFRMGVKAIYFQKINIQSFAQKIEKK